ncbi:MAG TPA: xanthine dehydrogenase family protein molybdopterin-binding subunit [Micropepsaceae bacterium]|nr:xanthine dehydrogenase family protein molybdopterin-binding subunit [Micropepsaceae bacterium]
MTRRFPDAERRSQAVGRSLPRLEDEVHLRGKGRFVDDINFKDELHLRVARSQAAHGRIVLVDIARAHAAPGVVAVWTGLDLAETPPIDFRDPAPEALKPYRQPALALDKVRYVGEPVAAIFAETPYLAEDAANLVELEIAELPPLLSAKQTGEFAPSLSTEPVILKNAYGDIDAAFKNAVHVVELELSIGRHSGVPMETRGALARYDETNDVLELYGAAKVPHRTRDNLARILGRSPQSVHLKEGHTGGGFGIRGELYPEDVLVSLAALKFKRPVKWIEDRREHLMAANHSREQFHRVRAAVDGEGRLLGLDDEFFHSQGGYIRTHGVRVPDLTSSMVPGPYRIPAYRSAAHFRLTNKTPAATYRAPGRYEGTFVRERLMDAIAAKLNLDRIEVRRRNLIGADEMPYARGLTALGTDVVYDSGDFARLLNRALEKFQWEKTRGQLARRRTTGEAVGVGLGFFVEKTGLGPKDSVRLSVDESGRVTLVTGGASLGQGFETVMAQICAEGLGVGYDFISVIHGQTNLIADGIGAHASRATVITGSATYEAARALRAKILEAAGELLQAPADALAISGGEVVLQGRETGPSVALGEIARRHGGLITEGQYHTDHMTYPYGAHIAQVRVDRETGQVTVERFLVAYDIGRAVNPMMIEGQIVGGFAQGMGGALFEEFLYDANGSPLSVTFADYLIPTSCEVTKVEVLILEDAPSPLNALGIKGAGEAGVTASGAAIASAIDDAIGIPGAITSLPVTPARLLELLKQQ